eukprot:4510047-Pleurochrysis_carterae.AAC.1
MGRQQVWRGSALTFIAVCACIFSQYFVGCALERLRVLGSVTKPASARVRVCFLCACVCVCMGVCACVTDSADPSNLNTMWCESEPSSGNH